MRALSAITLALSLLATPHARADETCVGCHAQRAEPRLRRPVSSRAHDVHAAAELGCADCHGGDPDAPDARAHDLGRGFRGVPDPIGTAQLCGRCHDGSHEGLRDVLTGWRAGRHGRSAELEDGVASCTSCHGAHGIARHDAAAAPVARVHVAETCGACHASQARMAGSGLPTDQLAGWRTSVHGAAFTTDPEHAPTCSTCHDPHDNAAGLAAIAACTRCHGAIREAFDHGPHAAHFERMGFLDCAECHESHAVRPADATLLSGLDAACARCHGPGQEAFERVARIQAAGARLDVARAVLPREAPERAALLAALHRLDADDLEARLDALHLPASAPVPTPAAPAGTATAEDEDEIGPLLAGGTLAAALAMILAVLARGKRRS